MKIVKATTARNNFQDVIDEVHYNKKPIIITKRNKPWAIITALPEEDNKK
ncbi:MAG: type II toxin-antitoxin system Phd/YefM family antitoxin [Minisyncoccales bacterium]|jgi:prevent-host-death family protein|nr:type II toxin-antitoxin system Phd/YefM family antitoxin [Candidatus Paceibacterota bacterium]